MPNHLSDRDRLGRKLRTKLGRQRYGLRKETVEPVFGQVKEGRGFRQFLLRSLQKVNWEWLLICTGHNLLKLFRFGARPPRKARGNGPTGKAKKPPGTVSSSISERLSSRLGLPSATIVVAR